MRECFACHKLVDRVPSPDELRAVREVARVSQTHIAETLGVAPATVSRWETGARQPNDRVLLDYLDLLAALGSEDS